jgi:hypothetical protein
VEPQVEGREYQDNPDIHYQAFPEKVSEEDEINADNNGYHRDHVKSDFSAHFSTVRLRRL